MTRKEALAEWRDHVLPHVTYEHGLADAAARRESWIKFIDQLSRNDRITERQAQSWSHPQ